MTRRWRRRRARATALPTVAWAGRVPRLVERVGVRPVGPVRLALIAARPSSEKPPQLEPARARLRHRRDGVGARIARSGTVASTKAAPSVVMVQDERRGDGREAGRRRREHAVRLSVLAHEVVVRRMKLERVVGATLFGRPGERAERACGGAGGRGPRRRSGTRRDDEDPGSHALRAAASRPAPGPVASCRRPCCGPPARRDCTRRRSPRCPRTSARRRRRCHPSPIQASPRHPPISDPDATDAADPRSAPVMFVTDGALGAPGRPLRDDRRRTAGRTCSSRRSPGASSPWAWWRPQQPGSGLLRLRLVLLPTLAFVGSVTFERTLQSSIRTLSTRAGSPCCAATTSGTRGDRSIRAERPARRAAPHAASARRSLAGIRTIAGMVAVITAVLAGSTAAVAAILIFDHSLAAPMIAGTLVALPTMIAMIRHQDRLGTRRHRTARVRRGLTGASDELDQPFCVQRGLWGRLPQGDRAGRGRAVVLLLARAVAIVAPWVRRGSVRACVPQSRSPSLLLGVDPLPLLSVMWMVTLARRHEVGVVPRRRSCRRGRAHGAPQRVPSPRRWSRAVVGWLGVGVLERGDGPGDGAKAARRR